MPRKTKSDFPAGLLNTLREIAAERDPLLERVLPGYREDMLAMLEGRVEMEPHYARAFMNALSPVQNVAQFEKDAAWRTELLNWVNAQETHKTATHYKAQEIARRKMEQTSAQSPLHDLPSVTSILPMPVSEDPPKNYHVLREKFIDSFAHATMASALLGEFGLQRKEKGAGRFSPADTDMVKQKLTWLMQHGNPAPGVTGEGVYSLFKQMNAIGSPSVQQGSENYRTMLTKGYTEARTQYLNLFHPVGARKADAKLAKFGLLPGDVAGPFDGVKPEISEIQQKNVPLLSQAKASQMLEELLKAAHRLRHEAQSQAACASGIFARRTCRTT